MSNLTSATYTYNGTSTGRGSLKNANVSANSPYCDISDYEKGFVSQADHGTVF